MTLKEAFGGIRPKFNRCSLQGEAQYIKVIPNFNETGSISIDNASFTVIHSIHNLSCKVENKSQNATLVCYYFIFVSRYLPTNILSAEIYQLMAGISIYNAPEASNKNSR